MAKRARVSNCVIITPDIARAAGHDVATRRMRAEGRQVWNDEDLNIAAERTMRLMVVGGLLPPAAYEIQIGKPYVPAA